MTAQNIIDIKIFEDKQKENSNGTRSVTHSITYIPLESPMTSRTEALNLTFAKNAGQTTINSSQLQTLANFDNGAIYKESEPSFKFIEQSPVFDLRNELGTPVEPHTSRT